MTTALTVLVGVVLALGGCGSSTGSPKASGPPNGLIALTDGRHLDLTCIGSGGPVVVLEAGLGNRSEVWIPVAGRVAAFSTVCRYDRAGLGRSDPRPEPHGAASAVTDLRALLRAANLAPPYLIVGASFGGLAAQLFARTYPTDTAGVVLVDAIPPDWDARLEALLTPAQVEARHAIPNGEPITNEELRAGDAAVLAAPPFPSVKLVVLRHDIPFPGDADWPTAKVESLWKTLQDGLAAGSPASVEIQAQHAGHRIHQDQPDLVADAIHAIVDPTRWPPTALGSTAGAAFGAGASPVADGSIPGRLLYTADDGLRSASMDGSDSRILVPSEGMTIGEPSIDSSGAWLTYTRRAPPPASGGPQSETPAEVWVLDTATGKRQMIAPDGELPAISPDASTIAFGREGHTLLVRRDGSNLRDLGEGSCAVWSPDGRQLAMCTRDDAVFVMTPPDGPHHLVPTGPGPNDPTAWLPDGGSLVLFSSRNGDGEIYLIGVDGSDEHRLTTAPGNQEAFAWTPAGLLTTSSLPGADVSDWFVVDPATGAARIIPWMTGIPTPVAYLPGG